MKSGNLAVPLLLASALISTSIFAHGVVHKEVTPTTALPYHWSGFYAGMNAGLVNHTMDITDNQATSFNATLQQTSNPRFTGGFQVGYRQQLDLTKTSGVYGLELSANFSNTNFSKMYGSPFATYQVSIKNELKNLCMLQLIGGIAADRTLLFLAAGLSWSNLAGSIVDDSSIAFPNSFNWNKQAFGTAIGGGMEYAFTDVMSIRIKVDVITPNTFTVSNDNGSNFQVANNIVQGTLAVNINLDNAKWFAFKA